MLEYFLYSFFGVIGFVIIIDFISEGISNLFICKGGV